MREENQRKLAIAQKDWMEAEAAADDEAIRMAYIQTEVGLQELADAGFQLRQKVKVKLGKMVVEAQIVNVKANPDGTVIVDVSPEWKRNGYLYTKPLSHIVECNPK